MAKKTVTITLRLPPEQQRRLERSARIRRVSRSEALRRALDEYCDRALRDETLTPYERLARWVPKPQGTGVRRLSEDSGEKYRMSLLEKYHGKHSH